MNILNATDIGDKIVVYVSLWFYLKNELTFYISYSFLIKIYSSGINNIFIKSNNDDNTRFRIYLNILAADNMIYLCT